MKVALRLIWTFPRMSCLGLFLSISHSSRLNHLDIISIVPFLTNVVDCLHAFDYIV
jgi:hypothetical protein